MSTTLNPERVNRIAGEIITSISIINNFLKEIEKDPFLNFTDNTLLDKTRAAVEVLGDQICEGMNNYPLDCKAALQKIYTFPSRFKEPATLEIILTFIYGMLTAYENPLCYVLIRETGHIMYSHQLQKANKKKVAALLK